MLTRSTTSQIIYPDIERQLGHKQQAPTLHFYAPSRLQWGIIRCYLRSLRPSIRSSAGGISFDIISLRGKFNHARPSLRLPLFPLLSLCSFPFLFHAAFLPRSNPSSPFMDPGEAPAENAAFCFVFSLAKILNSVCSTG